MITINSQSAKKLLEKPRAVKTQQDESMRLYQNQDFKVWVGLEWEQNNVKNLSFFGSFDDFDKIILESMASLLIGKNISRLDTLSLRECEAFLRDRNSEVAFTGMTEADETKFKKLFSWIRIMPRLNHGEEYHFSSEKGLFRNLKLVDKIREIKAFLKSPEVLTLYQNFTPPELVDVEDFTVYVQAPYQSEREKSLFEELHLMGVETFQEENLNFIPEG